MKKLLLFILFPILMFGQGTKISSHYQKTTLGNSDFLIVDYDSSGVYNTGIITVSYFAPALMGKVSTSDLSEGTNLYYTDARAIAALEGNDNTWSGSNTFTGTFVLGGVTVDTAASRTWVRDNTLSSADVVDITSTQTISGTKTFTGTVTINGSISPWQTITLTSDPTSVTINTSGAGNIKKNYLFTSASGVSNLCDIQNGIDGQTITILIDPNFQDAMVFRNNGGTSGNMRLRNNQDYTMESGDTLTLVYYATNHTWYELGRRMVSGQ